ncbi:MAG: hypothetical protein HC837_13385, partial [Chloroflexaceae bacterium]|nr:hypothetical protein [Chloroflexaceae bacterium]
EPDNNDATGISTNLTVDFGLYQPVSLGNQVWYDTNNDGIFDDTSEVGIENVTVLLWLDDGDGNFNPISDTLILTDTTDANGIYGFANLHPADYFVQIPQSQFASGAVLFEYINSTGNDPVPGPNDNVNHDDNGAVYAGQGVVSDFISLAADTEPTNDGDSSNDSNLTVDFGFYTLSLGDRVWYDTNNDGLFNGSEVGIANVEVLLYRDSNDDGTPDGSAVLSTTTSITGTYRFDGLDADTYIVEIVPPANHISSSGTNGSVSGPYEPAPDPDNNADGDDNGSDNSGTIRSAPITLVPNSEPDITSAIGLSVNTTVDFGLYEPLSLGNLVWYDLNNNGNVDGGEQGVDGVVVALWLDDGDGNFDIITDTFVLSDTTDASGIYGFTNLKAGNYFVQLPDDNFASGAVLFEYTNSTGNDPAPDPNNNVNNDDNGTRVAGQGVVSQFISLAANTEPINDGDINNDTNLTVDFGFYTMELGNLVWNDTNNDGLFDDTSEAGIENVTVRLYRDSNNDGTPDGAAIDTTTTDANGNYLFTGLINDTYIVEIVPPPDYVSSTGTPGQTSGPYEPAADPDNNTDDDDNGTKNGGTIRSAPITLVAGAEPDTDAVDGINVNLRVDFGLYEPLRLGNQVWYDTNNNGIFDDSTEVGIENVTVLLWLDDGDQIFDPASDTQILTDTTDASGIYGFANLHNADYFVQIPQSQFASGAVLFTYINSTGNDPVPGPNNNVNNDDNGAVNAGQGVVSDFISLAANTEPTDDGDSDNDSNLTVDFGFYTLSLGDRVWYDTNNDGLFNGSEVGIANVAVRLYRDSNNDGTPDGAAILNTTTSITGTYRFDGLDADTYIVEIVPPADHVSSSGTNGSLSGPYEPAPDPDNDTDNDDNGSDNGGTIRSAPITLTPNSEPDITIAIGLSVNTTVDFGLHEPLSLGNLVWYDTNNDGRFDDTIEVGVENVTVQLWRDDGDGSFDPISDTLVLTDTTDASGIYGFTNLAAGNYFVQLPADNFASGAVLFEYANSTGNDPVPDPDNNVDNDDNGSITANDGVVSKMITLAANTEPINDGDTNSDTNLTVDFGFYTMRLGNLVWKDTDNDGLYEPADGEAGIADVEVRLYRDSDNDGTPDGSAILTTTTSITGNYTFTGLISDTYIVEVVTPDIHANSTGARGFATGPYEPASDVDDNSTDDDDNGNRNGAVVRTYSITMVPGAEPYVDNALGLTENNTVDFGFFLLLNIGNLVWYDLNNNGIVDAGEPGIPNVKLWLRRDNGDDIFNPLDDTVVATQTTDIDGNYYFDLKEANDYFIQIPPENFDSGGPLYRYINSTGNNPVPEVNDDVNNDDNGAFVDGQGIVSTLLTLVAENEPIDDGDNDSNTNLTIDFGFYRLNLGNLVWNDQNNNGKVDAGEPGLPNVRVRLYRDSNNDGNPDGAAVRTTRTDLNGNYQFDDLEEDTYIVEVVPPARYISSSGTNGSTSGSHEPAVDPDDNDTDNDDNGTTSGSVVRSSPVTLEPGNETNNDTGTGRSARPTVDFGLYQPVSLGNQVWYDTNNDGILNANEQGVADVRVELWQDNGDGVLKPSQDTFIGFDTTDSDGLYLFTNLAIGDYLVSLPQSNFADGAVLNGYTNSTGNGVAPDPDDNQNNDDNGTPVRNRGVVSQPISLAPGPNQPTMAIKTPALT